tara:strand:- start:194 stop:976 length:783 start_codon:yes stop_codon:yes gene_type:complete
MRSKFHLATVKPSIEVSGNLIYGANDILFDWHRFEVPKGSFRVQTITAIVAGLDKAAAAGIDIEMLFARSLNGVAPPSLGAANAATTLIAATKNRNHIIGSVYLDASSIENTDLLVGYNVWRFGKQGNDLNAGDMILEGDLEYGSTIGYQSLWVAGFTIGTPNHGTTVLLNQAGNQAAATAADNPSGIALITDGGDADDVFGIGDEVMAYAADGSSPSKVGKVTAVSANLLTVDKVEEAFTDDDELCFRAPYIFHLGLEY